MRPLLVEGLTIACCVLLSSCGTQEITNAPPEVVEGCRREIAILTNRDPIFRQDSRLQGAGSDSAQSTIDDARIAKEEEDRTGLASWPEDVLLYRCLESRGIVLTPEQANVLAKWEQKSGSDSTESR